MTLDHGEYFVAEGNWEGEEPAYSPKAGEYSKVQTGKWYHYDETWANLYGPYDTEEEVKTALMKYAESL